MASDPTGIRFRIARGDVHAEITQVGAALRVLDVGGVALVPPYPDTAPTPAAAGIVLLPWPNRVAGGRWTRDGVTRQLAITEPAYGNASHGLLRFVPYQPVVQESDRITLAATVFPQTGYPFQLDSTVDYRVGPAGLTVTHEVVNAGADAAPFALGTHPYLQLGGVRTADLTIRLDAQTRFEVDDRLIPVAQTPVDAATDLRSPRRLGDLSLDTAYGDLARDADGRVRTTLTAPDGRAVELWQGEGFDYVQVFTTDRFPGQELAVAVEPMTAPADAFNTGQGLVVLAPGESRRAQWGIDYRR
ncbi:aldose 1-epimerase family protein [Microbacterium sp.]|uniref:aldose 1-epimerase family protein n=1 Tax=Microbacterium sp. TaxID=51671 RepID=UPI0039E3E93C